MRFPTCSVLFRRDHILFAVITRFVRNCALERVIQYSRDADARTVKPRCTGYSAFAEYDGGAGGLAVINSTATENNAIDKKQKCEAAEAVEALDPGAPTKVGGHHMTGSTDPVRDSSLKDR